MMRNYFIALLALVMASCGGNPSGNGIDSLSAETEFVPKFPITINVTQEYPQKTIAYEDLAEVSFVQLERTPDNLLNLKNTAVFTREDIFVNDKSFVYRYGRDGKYKNKIGRVGRGPQELAMFSNYIIDTLAKDVYMYDNGQHKTVVYNYDGCYKREFRKADAIYSLNFETISPATLVIGRQLKAFGDRPMESGQLFAEISKEDGKEVRKFGPYIADDNKRTLHHRGPIAIRLKDEVIIENSSSDTIYTFKQSDYPNLVFKPRYILTPHKFCNTQTRYDVFVCFESIKQAFLMHSKVNCTLLLNLLSNNQSPSDATTRSILMIDKKSGNIADAKLTLGGVLLNEPPSSAGLDNIAYILMQPYKLLEMKEKGEIKNPQLLSIAETITEDSNPVLVVLKFR